MTATTNLGIDLLETGQINKDPTINTGFSKIDATLPLMLADAASDPATTGKAPGSTYFNTTAKVMKILTKSGVWSVANGYLGEFSTDPATTNLQAGSTYYNSTAKMVKILNSSSAWTFATGYLGEFAADPATTSLGAGATYFNTATSKLKLLKSDSTWVNVA